jgi:hypothetical protein
MLVSLPGFAAQDPVSWRLSPAGGFPVTQIGQQSVVTYTLTNHLREPAVILTSILINGFGFSVEDGCNNATLLRGGSCNITVRYVPTVAGTSTFQLIYGYHKNRIPLPLLTATASGVQPGSSLSGIIPNFPTAINPTGTVPFAAVFRNTGTATLSNCFAGNAQGTNMFTLTPANTAQLSVLTNNCGTVGSPITLAPQAFCSVTGRLAAPYQSGPFTLSALMNCNTASSQPSVTSTVLSPTAALTGTFTQPSPFPPFFYDNSAPFVTARFVNSGNTTLTNCQAATTTGFSISPSGAAVLTAPQPGTCGTAGTPITLAPNASCFLYGQLTNLQVTPNVNLNATVNCTEAQASPQETFSILSSAGACTDITITPVLPLPTNTYKYADNVVKFQITNQCQTGEPPVLLGPVTVAPSSGTATIAPIPSLYDTCSNQALTSGTSCTVTASAIPTSVGALAVTASVTPSGGALTSATTTTTVATNQQPTHHILFVNQCNFDVWYGISNGDGSSCPGTTCKSPDPNLITNPTGAPASSYFLAAQVPGQTPSTIDLSVASYQNGAFWPRTGCTFNSSNDFVCATGSCATMSNSGTCNSTGALIQPQAPFTKFEANLNSIPGTDGIYDVSAINGMNVPVEVKAFGPSTGNTTSTVYTCSGAGAIMQPTSNNHLGNCTWTYNPSSTITGTNVNNYFYWVTPGADDACTTSSLPNLCGMAWGSGPDSNGVYGTPINRRQGAFLAYNTLDVFAAYTVQGTNNGTWGSVNVFTDYGLDIQIPGQVPGNSPGDNYGTVPGGVIFPGNTFLSYYVLMSCPAVSSTSALNSCYQNSTNNYIPFCCGCVDWTNTLPSNACGYAVPSGDYSIGMNYSWTGYTSVPIPAPVGSYTPEQAITWIKDACPTAYSYTYDDPSSSFSCTEDSSTPLTTSYQVTFCPGGISGLPTGATDGRSTAP